MNTTTTEIEFYTVPSPDNAAPEDDGVAWRWRARWWSSPGNVDLDPVVMFDSREFGRRGLFTTRELAQADAWEHARRIAYKFDHGYCDDADKLTLLALLAWKMGG